MPSEDWMVKMCDKECDFEYGDAVEVSNDNVNWNNRTFIAYIKIHPNPYLATSRNIPMGFMAPYFYKYARRPLPDIKPGEPILVWNNESDIMHLRFFKHFKNNKAICIADIGSKSKPYSECDWNNWKLLEGYHYGEVPPPVKVEG